MKNPTLIFKAQNLDNESPDYYAENGSLVPPREADKRRHLAEAISEIALRCKKYMEKQGVTILIDRRSFLVEIAPFEYDVTERMAPILCCGVLPDADFHSWSDHVITSLEEFARSIGRSLPQESLSLARSKLATIAWRKKKGRNILASCLAVILTAGLSAALWIVRRRY